MSTFTVKPLTPNRRKIAALNNIKKAQEASRKKRELKATNQQDHETYYRRLNAGQTL